MNMVVTKSDQTESLSEQWWKLFYDVSMSLYSGRHTCQNSFNCSITGFSQFLGYISVVYPKWTLLVFYILAEWCCSKYMDRHGVLCTRTRDQAAGLWLTPNHKSFDITLFIYNVHLINVKNSPLSIPIFVYVTVLTAFLLENQQVKSTASHILANIIFWPLNNVRYKDLYQTVICAAALWSQIFDLFILTA